MPPHRTPQVGSAVAVCMGGAFFGILLASYVLSRTTKPPAPDAGEDDKPELEEDDAAIVRRLTETYSLRMSTTAPEEPTPPLPPPEDPQAPAPPAEGSYMVLPPVGRGRNVSLEI